MRSRPARRTEISLDRSTILTSAWELVNKAGLERFSLRALGTQMSVHATAIYYHFDGKPSLLQAMAGQIYA